MVIKNIAFPAISINAKSEIAYVANQDDLSHPIISDYEKGMYKGLRIVDYGGTLHTVRRTTVLRDKFKHIGFITRKIYNHRISIGIENYDSKIIATQEVCILIIGAIAKDPFWLSGGNRSRIILEIKSKPNISDIIEFIGDLMSGR